MTPPPRMDQRTALGVTPGTGPGAGAGTGSNPLAAARSDGDAGVEVGSEPGPEASVTPEPEAGVECGTRCFSNLESSVRVTGDDYARLGDAADRFVHFVGNRAYMRLADGHCATLRVELEGRFVCTVYATRPNACRNLELASPDYQGAFHEEGASA